AMSDVDNVVVIKTQLNPYILYVEGEDDERLLIAWAEILGHTSLFNSFHIHKMGGTTKDNMKKLSDDHFNALKQINPKVKRVVLFDYDSEETFHPAPDNPVIKEWKRKNIENYLLVPEAWKKAILDVKNQTDFDLFSSDISLTIDHFFSEQGLVLPKNANWKTIKANIFEVVNGKKILFENNDSLFHSLKLKHDLKINREKVANNMTVDEIHEDIISFFDFIKGIVEV
ncbi:MAG: hypothetical protein WAU01_16515, partial [Saprospiraceae bacterium]